MKIKLLSMFIFLLILSFSVSALKTTEQKNIDELIDVSYSDSRGQLYKSVSFSLSPQEINSIEQNGYDILLKEGYSYIDTPGHPKLPFTYKNIILPQNAKISDVKIVSGKYSKATNRMNIHPASPAVMWMHGAKQNLTISADSDIYSSSNLYPGKFISWDQAENNQNIVNIKIFPIQYNAVLDEVIVVESLIIKIDYELEEKTLRTFSYQEEPVNVNEAKNIIITSASLKETAEKLALFHTGTGTPSMVITTEELYNYTNEIEPEIDGCNSGCSMIENGYNYTLAKRIIGYLENESLHPNLTFVTLVGDALLVPPSYYVFGAETTPTDYFYSSPDLDNLPDYHVGRLPVNNEAELDIVIDKIMRWYNSDKDDWFDSTTVAGGRPFNTDFFYGEVITMDSVNKGYAFGEINKLFETDSRFNDQEFGSVLEKGRTGVIYEIGHGSGSGLHFDSSPAIYAEDVMDYDSNEEMPIVVSIACTNGQFDTDIVNMGYNMSFGESTVLSEGGAFAYIGGARTNYGAPNLYLDRGNMIVGDEPFMAGLLTNYMMALTDNNTEYLGQAASLALEKFYSEKDMNNPLNKLTFYEFIFMGDPALRLPNRTRINDSLIASINSQDISGWQSTYEGLVPLYEIDNNKNITIDISNIAEQASIKLYSVDEREKEIDQEINNSIFSFNPQSNDEYQIRITNNDGKESWYLFEVEHIIQGVEIDAEVYGYDDTVILGYNTSIVLELDNKGTMTNYNSTYNLTYHLEEPDYEKINTCLSECNNDQECENCRFIESGIISEGALPSLSPNSAMNVVIEWKPQRMGDYEIRLETEIPGDVNTDNNQDTEYLRVSGWNSSPYIDYVNTNNMIINESNEIEIVIGNSGTVKSENTSLKVYLIDEISENLTLIDEKNISEIFPRQVTEATINITPTDFNQLYRFEVDASNGNSHYRDTFFEVRERGPDVAVQTYYQNIIPIVGNETVHFARLYNYGTQSCKANISTVVRQEYFHFFINDQESREFEMDNTTFNITIIDTNIDWIKIRYEDSNTDVNTTLHYMQPYINNNIAVTLTSIQDIRDEDGELIEVGGAGFHIGIINKYSHTEGINIDAEESIDFNVTWTPKIDGYHSINVYADCENDTNLNNNGGALYYRARHDGLDISAHSYINSEIIEVDIENMGTIEASNITVKINHTNGNFSQILDERIINDVNIGNSRWFNINWTPIKGENIIIVTAEIENDINPDDNIKERHYYKQNTPPTIINKSPVVQSVRLGENVSFWIEAKDDDNDSLFYEWQVDVTENGVSQTIFYAENITNITFNASSYGNYEVFVGVMDDEDEILDSWQFRVARGDLNDDGKVSILDIILERKKMGMTSSDDDWDDKYDLNGDGTINIFDLIILRGSFN